MATEKHHDTTLKTQRVELSPPRLYKVILLNDDFTPMDFVIMILERFFSLSRERAIQLMLQVHNEGKAICGIFPHDIATTKVAQVCNCARQHQHPLVCTLEEE